MNKQSWESAIGRVYKTRGDERIQIQAVTDTELMGVERRTGIRYYFSLDGNATSSSSFDLMEMVRQSNFTTTDMKSCG